MSFPATIRSVLAFAALAAIGVPTFLPALHALPGMAHGDCACGDRHSAGDPVYVRESCTESARETCGGCEHGTCFATVDAPKPDSSSSQAELYADADSDCLLCALFASFVLSKPEQGFVPPATDVVAAQLTPAPTAAEVELLAAACRGPPAAV